MKRFLILCFLLFPLLVGAQTQGTNSSFIRNLGGYGIDSILTVPVRDTTIWNSKWGNLTIRPQDNILYWKAQGGYWNKVASSSGTGGAIVWNDTISTIATKKNLKDTASALRSALSLKENLANKITSFLGYATTDTTYPTTGAVSEYIQVAVNPFMYYAYDRTIDSIDVYGTTTKFIKLYRHDLPALVDSFVDNNTTYLPGWGLLLTGNTFRVDTTKIHSAYHVDSMFNSTVYTGASPILVNPGTHVISHASSGVTPGTYTKIVVDALGHTTSGTALAPGDIPNINQNQVNGLPDTIAAHRAEITNLYTTKADDNTVLHITGNETVVNGIKVFIQSPWVPTPTLSTQAVNLGYIDNLENEISNTYIPLTQRGAPDGVATLLPNGKIPNGQIPAIAITETFPVNSEAEMLALSTAEQGDVAVRMDISKSFILIDNSPGTLSSWQWLMNPMVSNTDQVPEGTTNLYFTTARARQSVSASGDISYNPSTGVFSYTTPPGLPPTGVAGGDLSGTYPNPSVVDNSHNHTITTLPGVQDSLNARIPMTSFVQLNQTFANTDLTATSNRDHDFSNFNLNIFANKWTIEGTTEGLHLASYDSDGLIINGSPTSGQPAYLKTDSIAGSGKSFQFPNASGTLALRSDIPSLAGYWQYSDTVSILATRYWVNTTFIPLSSYNTLNENFANTNLTTTGNRAHSFGSNSLSMAGTNWSIDANTTVLGLTSTSSLGVGIKASATTSGTALLKTDSIASGTRTFQFGPTSGRLAITSDIPSLATYLQFSDTVNTLATQYDLTNSLNDGMVYRGSLATSTNLNTIITTGFYSASNAVSATLVNAPQLGSPLLLEVWKNTTAGLYCVQRATYNGNVSYRRFSADGGTVWSAWLPVGTITNFSAGDLSPLFTTTEATTTTTPALSFSLSNAGANTFFGNNTGSTAAPSFTAMQGLTKTDDANVTLTLGGTPTTSLLKAVSMTLGWTGQLSVARGGTGAGTLTGYVKGNGTSAFTASATIPYSDISGTPSLSGYELLSNKATSLTSPDNTKYPTTLAVSTELATKEPVITPGTTGQYWRGDKTWQTIDWLTGNQSITWTGTGDITGTASGATSISPALTIANNAVTNAKAADMATQTFKGRTTAGTGDPEDLTIAQAKTMLNLTGTNSGDQTITLTGDVTGSGTGSFATAIASGVIVNADINASADIAQSKMAALTASRAMVTDGSGFASASSVTSAELGYSSGVTSAIQTQLNGKEPTITLLPVSKGGTGIGTLTGVTIGNGTSAFSAVSGTASQLLRRNAANTAYEFFTPPYLTSYTETDPIYTATIPDQMMYKSVIPGSVNLNTYGTTGKYLQNSDANAANGTNYPVARAGELEVTNLNNGDFIMQKYQAYNNYGYYQRSLYTASGSWTPWIRYVGSNETVVWGTNGSTTMMNGYPGNSVLYNSGSQTDAPYAGGSFTWNAALDNTSGVYSAQMLLGVSAGTGGTTDEFWYRTNQQGGPGWPSSWFRVASRSWASANLSPLTGGSGYIQNTTSPQTANFSITGDGEIDGNLTIANGTVSVELLGVGVSNPTEAIEVQGNAKINGLIEQAVTSGMLKAVSGVITQATPGTDYVDPASLNVSGAYTPTLVNAGAGTVTPAGFTYLRNGDVIHVVGRISCSGLTVGNNTVTITLPVSSAITNSYEILGVVSGNGLTASPNLVQADVGTDTALLTFSTSGTSASVYVSFQYLKQ